MESKAIHVIGHHELVILFALAGINGTVIESTEEIMRTFRELIADETINIIIIATKLPDTMIKELIQFRIVNISPLIVYLPLLDAWKAYFRDITYEYIADSLEEVIS